MTRPYPIIDMEATGRNILLRRLQMGYTALDVQRYLGFSSPQAVYQWQAGKTLPSLDNFYALSVMLNTTVNALVAEREPQPDGRKNRTAPRCTCR